MHQRRQHSHIIKTFFALVLGGGIFLLFLLPVVRERKHQQLLDQEIAKQQAREKDIAHENMLLKEFIAYEKTPIAQQRRAHAQGYVAQNENVAVVPDTLPDKPLDDEEKKDDDVIVQPWRAWYSVFFERE